MSNNMFSGPCRTHFEGFSSVRLKYTLYGHTLVTDDHCLIYFNDIHVVNKKRTTEFFVGSSKLSISKIKPRGLYCFFRLVYYCYKNILYKQFFVAIAHPNLLNGFETKSRIRLHP